MKPNDVELIFVNQKPYRIWTGDSILRTEDFLRGFDPNHHLEVAKLLEPGIEGPNSETAALGIRTLQGLASEAFFALLFALVQAPTVPAAWLLLYKPSDLEELIAKVVAGVSLPSRLKLKGESWKGLAHTLFPIRDEDLAGAPAVVTSFGELWERLAGELTDESARREFNSLKHGLRARAASPLISLGGHVIPAAEHGSSFPVANKLQADVRLSIGLRSWSARSLLAQLELISASQSNLLALFKQLHGIEQHLELTIPKAQVFEAAKPPRAQVLSSLTLNSNWPDSFQAEPIRREEALELYRQGPRLQWARR